MIINCKNILSLPYVNQLNMVAGESGKYNIIKNVHVVEEMSLLEFVDEGELIMCMGCTLTDQTEDWIKLIESTYNSKAAGFVICLGICLKSTPKELIELCNNLEFPLFELRREIRISNVIHSIYQAMFQEADMQEGRDHFFREVIEEKMSISPRKIQKAEQYGFRTGELYEPAIIQVLEYHVEMLDVKKEVETVCEYDYMERVENSINMFTGARLKGSLTIVLNSFIMLLLPAGNLDNRELLAKLRQYLKQDLIDVKISVGLRFSGLEHLAESCQRAFYTMKVSGQSEEPVIYYRDLKVQTILYEVKDKNLLREIMGRIYGRLQVQEKEKVLFDL
ncbi:MAG: PucR family transcriptional regulator ligand-binding domain-containing protein [Lachnospiraceae bacterium]